MCECVSVRSVSVRGVRSVSVRGVRSVSVRGVRSVSVRGVRSVSVRGVRSVSVRGVRSVSVRGVRSVSVRGVRSARGMSVGRGMQTAAQVNALPACHGRHGFCIFSVPFLGLLLLASVPLPGLNAVHQESIVCTHS